MAVVLRLSVGSAYDECDLRIGSIKETGDARPLLSHLAMSGSKIRRSALDRVATYFNSLGVSLPRMSQNAE